MATSERIGLNGVNFRHDTLASLKRKACAAMELSPQAVSHFLLLHGKHGSADQNLHELSRNGPLNRDEISPQDCIYVEFHRSLPVAGKETVKHKRKRKRSNVLIRDTQAAIEDGLSEQKRKKEQDCVGVVDCDVSEDRPEGENLCADPTSSVGSRCGSAKSTSRSEEKISSARTNHLDQKSPGLLQRKRPFREKKTACREAAWEKDQKDERSAGYKPATVMPNGLPFSPSNEHRLSKRRELAKANQSCENALSSENGSSVRLVGPQARIDKEDRQGKSPGPSASGYSYSPLDCLGSPTKSVVPSSKHAQNSTSRNSLFSSLRRISSAFSLY